MKSNVFVLCQKIQHFLSLGILNRNYLEIYNTIVKIQVNWFRTLYCNQFKVKSYELPISMPCFISFIISTKLRIEVAKWNDAAHNARYYNEFMRKSNLKMYTYPEGNAV